MEPYTIEKIPIHSVTTQTIAKTYVGAGKAVIFTDVLNQTVKTTGPDGIELVDLKGPWARCADMADLRFYANHPEASKLIAEINVQKCDEIQKAWDFEMENLTAEAAVDLLHLRQSEDPSTARTGSDCADEVLYVKLSLTGCEELMAHADLQSFANVDATTMPFAPADHPLLLGPGSYFCWAYIGEKGSGSKTHVDVASSDAFLTVLTGKKEWAMVHPLDKHLVMDADGKMADLFNIDHTAFPEAHRARLCTFIQETGDCVFVPSDAPHCVRNLEFSVSITYNFALPSTMFRFHTAMDKVMAPKPTIATVDLLVYCPEVKERAILRGFVKDLPAPLPTTDYDCRMRLSQLHSAFGIYGRFLDADHVIATPIGYELCPKSHRIIYYYQMDSAANFKALFGRPPFASEPYVNEATCMPPLANRFLTTSSHFGAIPSFPPLRVMINQPLTPLAVFPTCTISSVVSPSSTAGDEAEKKDDGADGTTSTAIPSSIRQWHYSRFPFTAPSGGEDDSKWCRTYLFYSSHDIHGPVSLHPLLEDGTLQTSQMLLSTAGGNADTEEATTAANKVGYAPHFEAFSWKASASSQQQALLYNLSDDLVGNITKALVLGGEGMLMELLSVVAAHGYAGAADQQCDKGDASPSPTNPSLDALLSMGLEKVMILVLYFSCAPNVVGFTYSHTFSAVEEPNTVCLTAGAADALLKPLVGDAAAAALTAYCNAIDKADGVVTTSASPYDVPPTMEELTQQLIAAFPTIPDVVGKITDVKDSCRSKML